MCFIDKFTNQDPEEKKLNYNFFPAISDEKLTETFNWLNLRNNTHKMKQLKRYMVQRQ